MGGLHAQSIAALAPDWPMHVYDPNMQAATRLASRVGAAVSPTLDAVISAAEALVVATPASQRFAVLRAAIEAGLPIFCEKPLAATAAEASDIAALAEKSGARIHIGFQRRCDPEYVQLQQIIQTGQLGRVLLVRATAFDHLPPAAQYEETAGDIFADCLIHDIDAVRWLTAREPVAVQAEGGQLLTTDLSGGPNFDVATVVLTLSDGSRAVLTASRLNPLGYDHRIEILGTEDSVSVGLTDRTPLRRLPDPISSSDSGDPVWKDFTDRFADAYREEICRFMHMVTVKWDSPCDAREAAIAQRIAAAAALSASTGQRVEISEDHPVLQPIDIRSGGDGR
jgi:myo-inositol 2-dehydrogenase/D-chiro-inositol 1-dehydrogenase